MRCHCCNTQDNIKLERKTGRYYCDTCFSVVHGNTMSLKNEHPYSAGKSRIDDKVAYRDAPKGGLDSSNLPITQKGVIFHD